MRIRTHVNPFSCRKRFEKINPTALFERFNGTIDLEIGFGQSIFIKNYAQNHPNNLVFGVETRKQAVEFVQEKITQAKLDNVHLIHGNGQLCLEDMFEDNSIDSMFIFHPDPWFKHRHHKRRLISPEFVALAIKKLKPGGKIHISTDVQDLWLSIVAVLEQSGALKILENDPFWTTDYATRWDQMSKEKQRETFCATFVTC